MLAFRPDLVDMGRARDFRSSAEGAPVPLVGPVAYGWIASDLNPEGVVGNAAAATADKGRATASHYAAAFLALVRDVAALPAGAVDEPDAVAADAVHVRVGHRDDGGGGDHRLDRGAAFGEDVAAGEGGGAVGCRKGGAEAEGWGQHVTILSQQAARGRGRGRRIREGGRRAEAR
jgi:hypothetical protein